MARLGEDTNIKRFMDIRLMGTEKEISEALAIKILQLILR